MTNFNIWEYLVTKTGSIVNPWARSNITLVMLWIAQISVYFYKFL